MTSSQRNAITAAGTAYDIHCNIRMYALHTDMQIKGKEKEEGADFIVIVSVMQLLRLRSTICRHHPPQRAVLSQICCFGERKVALFQIPLDSAERRDVGMT